MMMMIMNKNSSSFTYYTLDESSKHPTPLKPSLLFGKENERAYRVNKNISDPMGFESRSLQ